MPIATYKAWLALYTGVGLMVALCAVLAANCGARAVTSLESCSSQVLPVSLSAACCLLPVHVGFWYWRTSAAFWLLIVIDPPAPAATSCLCTARAWLSWTMDFKTPAPSRL